MIGKVLRQMRLNKGLSQDDLAKILTLDQTTISGWERAYREPTFGEIEKIASVCDYCIKFENKSTKEVLTTNNIDRKEL